MSKTVIRVALPLAAVGLAVPAGAGPAHAAGGEAAAPSGVGRVAWPSVLNLGGSTRAGQDAERRPRGDYIVSVTDQAGQQTVTTLRCRPGGGEHPHRREACAQLAEAAGDIAAIPPADGVCTMEYDPVLVRAVGAWDGTHQEYENVFPNRCVAVLETGGYVFRI